jgi:branched-chain amino acid transport system permease protein
MITGFIAYEVLRSTGSYWEALAVALAAGLVIGALVERLLMRPVETGPPLNAVIVTLGLLIFLEGLAGYVFGGQFRSFRTAYSNLGLQVGHGRIAMSPNDLFIIGSVLAVAVLLLVLFRFTSLGLRMRASAFAPEVARLLGVRVGRLLTLGWALAAVVGSLAGVLAAPTQLLYPSYMDSVLVFGFVAAVLGGLDSPLGAVVGGLVLGIVLSYVAGYLGSGLVPIFGLFALMAVLLVRPEGLFSHATGRRV